MPPVAGSLNVRVREEFPTAPSAAAVIGLLLSVAETGVVITGGAGEVAAVVVVPLVIVCSAGCASVAETGVVITGGAGEVAAVVVVPLVIVCSAGCAEVPMYS